MFSNNRTAIRNSKTTTRRLSFARRALRAGYSCVGRPRAELFPGGLQQMATALPSQRTRRFSSGTVTGRSAAIQAGDIIVGVDGESESKPQYDRRGVLPGRSTHK